MLVDTSNMAKFRRRLLGRTIAHAAACSPFYESLYRGLPIESIRNISDLPRLPVVRRGDLLGHEENVLCRGQRPAYLQHTGGTTGTPLLLVRSAEENQFRQQFFRPSGGAEVEGDMPLVMVVVEAYHGTMTEIPSRCFVVQGSVISDTTITSTLGMLRRNYRLPGVANRISLLGGSDTAIRLLTHYGQAECMPLAELRLFAVQTCGDFISRRVRRWIQNAWGAPLIDRYSCAEHFGGATSVPGTDIYRFDPVLVPEVLHPLTQEPIHCGIGVLTLTSLYPFVQAMPMIRYWTDDLVEIVEADDYDPHLSVRLKGRLHECVFDPRDGQPLVSSTDVRNAIEEMPAVVYRTRRSDLRVPGVDKAIGKPDYEMSARLMPDEQRGHYVQVKLDVRIDPSELGADSREYWERALAGRVLSECQALSALCRGGVAVLEVRAVDAHHSERRTIEASVGGRHVEPA